MTESRQEFPARDLRETRGGDALEWEVPDTWQQGRGSWGGLVVSAIVSAVQRRGDGRPVRSVSVQMLAPVPVGPVSIHVAELRRGSATTSYAVTLRDGTGSLLTTSAVVTGDPRVPDLDTTWSTVERPEAAPWPDVPVVPLAAPIAPTFTQHLQWRPIAGWPASGSAVDPLGWLWPPGITAYDEATLLGLVDAWWPACLVRLPAMRPMATLAFEASLVADPASLDPAAPLLHRGRIIGGRDGYVVESRELWSPDGRLVVTNVQTTVIIA